MSKTINTNILSILLTLKGGEDFIKSLINYVLTNESILNGTDIDMSSFMKETTKNIHPLALTNEYQNLMNEYFTKYHFELYPNKLYNLVRFGEHDINGLIVNDKMTFESDMIYNGDKIKIYSNKLELQQYLDSLSTDRASDSDWAFLVKTSPCVATN